MRSSVPHFPSLAPPNHPPTVYLYGEWAVLCCAPWRGQKLSAFALSGGTCELALCSGRHGKRGEGCGTSWVIRWAPGSGEGGRLLMASITFFPICLSLFFPCALSVSSLLIRSPNPPAFTVEKTRHSGIWGVRGCTHKFGILHTLGSLVGGGRGGGGKSTQTCSRQVWVRTTQGWFRGGGRGSFKKREIIPPHPHPHG